MMQDYKFVKMDSSALSDDDLIEFSKRVRSNSVPAITGLGMHMLQEIVEDAENEGRPGLIGAAFDITTEDGAIIGKFSYFVMGEGF